MTAPECTAISRLLFIAAAFLPISICAQNPKLTLQAGSNLVVSGGSLVLNNTDWQTDGALDVSGASLLITGNNNTTFSGTTAPVVGTLVLNTSGATTLTLFNTLRISGALNFQNGLIDLNNQQIQLTGNAVLQNESETSRITGLAGGMVTISATGVSNPNQLNPGNLGAILTTSANLGNLSISRMAKPAINPTNSAMTGIQRSFLIQPQNDVALNATLRFHYLAAELNGKNENTLTLWKSLDGIHWNQVGADSRNTTTHYVEKTGIADLSYWTLTDASNPLPITLLSFKATCEGKFALLQWTTGVESGTDYIEVERSTRTGDWTPLSRIKALNDPNGASYTYKDEDPQSSAYYRLKIVDWSGLATYSPVFGGGCSDITMPFNVYPNPASTYAVARLAVREDTKAVISIYSLGGQQLSSSDWKLSPGLNQFILPVSALAAGTYVVEVRVGNDVFRSQLIRQ